MSEAIYDAEIAPLLLQAAKLCEKHSMPFVASVEYAPGERGRTEVQPEAKASFAQVLAHWAARCNGNVDVLIKAVCQHARVNGHESVYLRMLDIPSSPGKRI